ncbi:MAG TPA: bifunctional DNA-formamidopyrimidine glycosylase/DNA-(apurinic or apyrimidinic site) lyase [Solirubrobacteraceae bacterium]|jgi:formamidopyrimidine-DNA glycosylase
MPELPEVETIRRQLAPLVEGRRLEQIEILDPRWSSPAAPDELEAALTGRVVERLGRRGKYLVWTLSDDVHLAQHLRMTGGVLWRPADVAGEDPPYTRVRLLLGPAPRRRPGGGDVASAGPRGPLRLAFVDARRFGTGQLLPGSEAMEAFFDARLGLEPLDERFTAEHLQRIARGRSTPVKSFLLDQRRVAGVGNIYADEALFRARIHPLRPAGSLTRRQWEAIRTGVIDALLAGIDARGATIDDFRDIDGASGSFQNQFLVHRREGEPCPGGEGVVTKLVVGGRGTYVCESCQRPPRRRRARSGGQ